MVDEHCDKMQKLLGEKAGNATDRTVVGALLKGDARASEVNAVIGQLWLDIAKLGIALQIGRVASKANIADEPTRGCKDWIEKSGATFHEPVIPEWLIDPWCAPDMAPGKLLRKRLNIATFSEEIYDDLCRL